MKLKLSLFTFIIGFILVVASFALRESYEKDMYQLYINQQKTSLIKGWNLSWQDFIINNVGDGKDEKGSFLNIDRNGKILTKSFFPRKSKDETDWSSFNALDIGRKNDFLKVQLLKKGTWDRAIAIKRSYQLNKKVPGLILSEYESTLVNIEKAKAYQLIFKQLEDKSNFNNIDKAYTLDTVLIRSESSGVLRLYVPSLSFLKNHLFDKFKIENRVSEIEIFNNPFEIQIKEGFNPFKFNSVRDKIMMGGGFIFLIFAVAIYLFELKNKRLEILKRVSFLNQLVHEVKTPITGIRLNSELLLKHGHDEELINALLKSSNRLNEFFEDIMLINRSDNKKKTSKLSQSEFSDYINFILDEFRGHIKLDNRVDSSITLDKGRTRVVLRNLLKNAIRYGKTGECRITIKDARLVISVTDEGPGVSLVDSPNIFDEFYRSKSAQNSTPDGLGIGLSIVKNLVSQMDGTIELTNPGKEKANFLLVIGGINGS